MKINNLDKEEIINYMVMNAIYPMWSKTGKIHFRCLRTEVLTEEMKNHIISQLAINSAEECLELRKKIREKVDAKRITRPINKWIKEERPREMLLQSGAQGLPLSKLLAIILRTGREGQSAEDLGRILLNTFGNLRNLDSAPVSDICKIAGIGKAKAVQIKASLELGKRLYRENAVKRKQIKSPEEVVSYAAEFYGVYLRDARKEYFCAILLDIKNKPIENVEISKGSISATIVDPREIIKEATLKSATSTILIHNHPSGDTTPSTEDIQLTRRIQQACHLVGIKVLDHIIIGADEEDYFSFAREGLLE